MASLSGMQDARIRVRRFAIRRAMALRVRGADAALRERLSARIGTPLPLEPNRTAGHDPRILWMAPGEWLILDGAATPEDLEAVFDGALAHVADVGDAWAGFRIAGAGARDLLAKGTSVDLHESVWPAGQCARTRFAQVHALIDRPADEPVFDLYADASLAEWLERWLADATIEFKSGRPAG